jgi:hypothetical protein
MRHEARMATVRGAALGLVALGVAAVGTPAPVPRAAIAAETPAPARRAIAPAPAAAAPAGLPLPPAPVRLAIQDVPAFDAALTGRFRRALVGQPEENDPLVAAWRQSAVGGKLEAQWEHLSGDLPWTWTEILRWKPRALGLALLSAGSLEAVLVLETPLAAAAAGLPAGTAKRHAGIAYSLVAPGAGDGAAEDRRAGLAWARHQSRLFLATSERALRAALDEAAARRGATPGLPGLVGLELDLVALHADRYFRREFLWGSRPGQGRVQAALRLEGGRLVEVREGGGAAPARAFTFEAPSGAAAAWEEDADALWPAIRAGLLEPIPTLLDRPVLPAGPLPGAARDAAEDRYLVRLDRSPAGPNAPWEEGEVAAWRALLAKRPEAGWGFALGADGARAVVFAWPPAAMAELEQLCRATVERRSGPVRAATAGDVRELHAGPGLPVLALRRTGEFVWLGSSARALAAAARPRPAEDLLRWARLDLRAVRSLAPHWARAEGPAAPERLRPFSDRVLGLLGWIPATTGLRLDRRRTAAGWTERLVFETE